MSTPITPYITSPDPYQHFMEEHLNNRHGLPRCDFDCGQSATFSPIHETFENSPFQPAQIVYENWVGETPLPLTNWRTTRHFFEPSPYSAQPERSTAISDYTLSLHKDWRKHPEVLRSLIENPEEIRHTISEIPKEIEKTFSENRCREEHRKGYALLHLISPGLTELILENIAQKKRLKMLEKKVTAQKSLNKARREKKQSLRNSKK
jgi:hypothetical protein